MWAAINYSIYPIASTLAVDNLRAFWIMWYISLVNREFWKVKENFQIHLWIFMVDQMHRKRQKSLDQALLHLQRLRWSAIRIKNMIFNCSKWFLWVISVPFCTVQVHFNCNSFPVTLLQYPKTPQLLVQSDKSFYLKWRPTSCAETQKYFTYNVLIEHVEIPYQRLK